MIRRTAVDLSAVDAVLRRVLAHPIARVAETLLPQTMGAVRAVADDLPAAASGLEARAIEHASEAARELEDELISSATEWVRETIRKGKGQARPKVLRAAPGRQAARKAKGKSR
jgi:hypothetical protein